MKKIFVFIFLSFSIISLAKEMKMEVKKADDNIIIIKINKK